MSGRQQTSPGQIAGAARTAGACAFFDVDGTLWNDRSVLSFYRLFLEQTQGASADGAWADFLAEAQALEAAGMPRDLLNEWFYARFADVEVAAVEQAARLWWDRHASRSGFWIDETVEEARRHVRKGNNIILVTGTFREIVAPLMEVVGACDAFVAPLEEIGGRYTGRLCGLPMIGPGKSEAVRGYMTRYWVDAREAFAYGDDESDIPFLELVGHPVAVATAPSPLAEIARTRNWTVLGCGATV